MTEIVPFDYGTTQVRTVLIDDEPWFVGADVCKVLGITDVGQAVQRVDQPDRCQIRIRSGEQNRSMWAVNESDTGQNRLAKWPRENGWTDRAGMPYQKQVDSARLAMRTVPYRDGATGEEKLTTQVRITAKGLAALHKAMGGVAALRPLAVQEQLFG